MFSQLSWRTIQGRGRESQGRLGERENWWSRKKSKIKSKITIKNSYWSFPPPVRIALRFGKTGADSPNLLEKPETSCAS
jgi:hypothetical protein